MQKLNFKAPLFTFISGLLLGALIMGLGMRLNPDGDESSFRTIRIANSSYQFTDPLIGFDFFDKKTFEQLAPLKEKMNKVITRKKEKKLITDAALYFRELGNGRWVGIDQDDLFAPRSLLKVPIMIAYLKRAETHPEILAQRLTYDPKKISVEPPFALEPGRQYSVEELINHMIVDSDNAAKELLLNSIDRAFIGDVFSDLGITQSPENTEGEYRISAKQYSIFFRALYNSTFLNNEMSERALTILSKVAYADGLVAGLPSSVQTAHKFGERVMGTEGKITGFELHDCGIVYYTEQSYFLCVMTQGADIKALEKTISEISKLTYEFEQNEYTP